MKFLVACAAGLFDLGFGIGRLNIGSDSLIVDEDLDAIAHHLGAVLGTAVAAFHALPASRFDHVGVETTGFAKLERASFFSIYHAHRVGLPVFTINHRVTDTIAPNQNRPFHIEILGGSPAHVGQVHGVIERLVLFRAAIIAIAALVQVFGVGLLVLGHFQAYRADLGASRQ